MKSQRKIFLFSAYLVFLVSFVISGKTDVYQDKLEFIRNFIIENYPTCQNYDFNIKTQAGHNENFIDFWGRAENLDQEENFGTWSAPKQESKTWLDFNLQVVNELKLKKLSIGGSGIDFIQKRNDFFSELTKKETLDLDTIRVILANLGAKYPVETGGTVRRNPNALIGGSKLKSTTIFYPGDIPKITSELLNRKSFWKFTHASPKKLKLSKDPVVFYYYSFENDLSLYWNIRLNDGKTEYEVNLEPFFGYIVGYKTHIYADFKK